MAAEEIPADIDAEMNVVGSILNSAKALDEVAEVLGPKGDVFYWDYHRLIYRAALALHAVNKPADVVTVADFLEKNEMEVNRGRLVELAGYPTTRMNAAHHARIVVEQARLRALLRVSSSIRELVTNREGRDAAELIAKAEDLVLELHGAHASTAEKIVTAYEAAEWLQERIKNPMSLDEGVPTPWSFLPRLLPGRMYVLAGYQADGKTAMSAEFIKSASLATRRVGFVTAEMGWQDVAVRLGANAGGSAKALETGHVRETDRESVNAAIGKVALMLGTEIIDMPTPSVAAISRVQRLKRYDLLIVDHLHQFPIEDPRFERQELERVLRGLVLVAREQNVPVILLAQLSRTGDPKKPYPRPSMASLRGSAMIEALAWSVWFVWRHRDEKNLPKPETEFIVAKNRSGRTGAWRLMFHDRQVRFTEIAPGEGGS